MGILIGLGGADMKAVDDKILAAVEKAGEVVLKHSERWSFGQKVVAFLVCLLAGVALASGIESIRVASGVTLALFGVSFLTFRRRIVETERLVLKDSKGKPRIVLSAEGGLVFFDENMGPRLVANVFAGQPAIHVTDDKESVLIAVGEGGATVGVGKNDLTGHITTIQRGKVYLGSLGGTRLTLDAREDSVGAVLSSGDKRPGVFLRATSSAGTARLGNPEGACVVISGAHDGNLGILMQNEKAEATAVLGSSGSSAHLSFIGENGRRVAQYPDEEALKSYAHAVTGE